jgi:hypothetical protein
VTIYWLLVPICRLLLTIYWLLVTIYRVLMTSYLSPMTIYWLPVTLQMPITGPNRPRIAPSKRRLIQLLAPTLLKKCAPADNGDRVLTSTRKRYRWSRKVAMTNPL